MDNFGKTEIRISPQQAQILLDLCKTVDTSTMTIEQVYALNSIHYSLESVKEIQ